MIEFVDPLTGVVRDAAFRYLLARETGRATRYQDFFSVCLLRPDLPANVPQGEFEQAVSRKIPEFVRSTDLIGSLAPGVAVLLLHTAETEAARVAERIRAKIKHVVFRDAATGRPLRLTVSVGKVSFPRDGHTNGLLLSQAEAYLEEAARRGGDQVIYSAKAQD